MFTQKLFPIEGIECYISCDCHYQQRPCLFWCVMLYFTARLNCCILIHYSHSFQIYAIFPFLINIYSRQLLHLFKHALYMPFGYISLFLSKLYLQSLSFCFFTSHYFQICQMWLCVNLSHFSEMLHSVPALSSVTKHSPLFPDVDTCRASHVSRS